MPKVDCITIPGLRIWFYSDDHLPWHFHVEKFGEWEIKVHFMKAPAEMCEVIFSARPRRPSKRDLAKLIKLAESKRGQLLAEWERKVNIKGPGAKK